MKRMKAALGMLLVLCLLLGAGTALGEGFRFREGIGWGMTPGEVRAAEQAEDLPFSAWNGYTVLTLPAAAVSRYTAPLTYFFTADGLCAAMYDFGGDLAADDEALERLTAALGRVYGTPDPADPARAEAALDALTGGRCPRESYDKLTCWTAEGDTLVAILRYAPDAFMILYADEAALSDAADTAGL